MPLPYRSDVDGLRAIAVLAILLFHMRESLLPGGFAGVDVFFAISGFLITSVVREELKNGSFSFARFYERRFRRIIPAYLAMLSLSMLAGAALLIPADFRFLGESALGSMLGLPNLHAWLRVDTGYFASASNQLPLLHLWSIGVEEQFYLFWPVLLLTRIGLLPTAALALASVAFAEAVVRQHPELAFYMLPARASELLLGALASLIDHRPRALFLKTAPWIGGALIAGSFALLNSKAPFPGLNSLYPSCGAALILYAGRFAPEGRLRLLSLRPLTEIGRSSYSLYLWHWPVLAFSRYFLGELNGLQLLSAAAATSALSLASYRWIEQPLWCKETPILKPVAILALLGGGLASWALVPGGSETLASFLPGYQERVRLLEGYTATRRYFFKYNCAMHEVLEEDILSNNDCVINSGGSLSGRPRILLWGDSNASHFVGLLKAWAEAKHFSFRNATLTACPPFFEANGLQEDPKKVEVCADFQQLVKSRMGDYDVFFLGAAWTNYLSSPELQTAFRKTLQALTAAGKKVVLMEQVPEFRAYDRQCEIKRLRAPFVDCVEHASSDVFDPLHSNSRLRLLASPFPATFLLGVRSVLCPEDRCSPYVDGRPVYFDRGHLSMNGSEYLGKKLLEQGVPFPPIFDP